MSTAPGTILKNEMCISSSSDFICEGKNCGETKTNNLNNFFDPNSGFTETCCSKRKDTVADSTAVAELEKIIISNGPYAPTGTNPVLAGTATDSVIYEITLQNDQMANVVLPNPILTDLLPEQLEYVDGSIMLIPGSNTTGLPFNATNPLIEIIPDYNGTGRTLLRWTFTGDFPIDSEVKYKFKTTIFARYGEV